MPADLKSEATVLSNDEILRYSRHLIMPEVGMDGQQKLKAARVLCIGAGGLGSPLALYLAAAGVGTLGIVDFDVVDYTNLQRQIIHSTADVGRKKLDSAAEKLKAINPFLNIRKFDTRLSSENALEIFREFKLRKNPDCPACGTHPTITKLIDYNEFCGIRGEEKPVETAVAEIQVEELKKRLDAGENLFVLDVREPHEYQICNIGGHLIPLGDLPKRVNELDSSQEIVAHCRSGVRSAKAVDFLRQAGFKKVHNLAGGILAWADRVDPKMPKY